MTQGAIDDLRNIQDYPRPPVKHAAYSDRAAWLMAIPAELAYTRFDQEDDSSILSLARELAELADPDKIVERLKGFAAQLGSARQGGANEDNALLRSALAVGGFRLKGVLFDAATDTRGTPLAALRPPCRAGNDSLLSAQDTTEKRLKGHSHFACYPSSTRYPFPYCTAAVTKDEKLTLRRCRPH